MTDERDENRNGFLGKSFNVSAPQATVVAAAIALIAGAAGAVISGTFTQGVESTKVSGQLDLERLKFQTSLILKAIDTPDQTTAVKTLKFFSDAGLIPAYEQKISKLASEDSGRSVPAIGSRYRDISNSIPPQLRELARSVGKFVVRDGGTTLMCTGILLSDDSALTIDHCKFPRAVEGSVRFVLGEADAEGPRHYNARFPNEETEVVGVQRVQLEGRPTAMFGGVVLRPREPRIGEPVALIHYPLGGPLKFSLDECFVLSVDRKKKYGLRYTCKTDPGSGGAPVIALSDFSILAIHAARVREEENLDGNLKDGFLLFPM